MAFRLFKGEGKKRGAEDSLFVSREKGAGVFQHWHLAPDHRQVIFYRVIFHPSVETPFASYRHSSPLKNQFRYTIGVISVVSRLMSTITT